MRKFTTLKEDLIKENYIVQRKFEEEFDKVLDNIENIREYLSEIRKDYEKEPGNWGFVGSLGHVNELLEQVVEFLGNADEEDMNTPKQLIPSDPNSEIQ